jgi:hypothetical protein
MVQIAESLGAARKAGAVADLCGGVFCAPACKKVFFSFIFFARYEDNKSSPITKIKISSPEIKVSEGALPAES